MKLMVMSIRARWIAMLLAGSKTVELRRKFPTIGNCDDVAAIIYATSPVKSVIAVARISITIRSSPVALWPQVAGSCGAERSEFFSYFAGATAAIGIYFSDIRKIPKPLTIGELRESVGFRPPVSWRWATSAEYDLLAKLVSSSTDWASH